MAFEVEPGLQRINETVLQHQGTVYPATAAAAPYLCQIALDEASLSRAALTAELAFLSAGYDEPYAPAGTALAVRDAIRPYAAYPAEAPAITPQLHDWFGRSEPPLRIALGLALGFHGLADEADRDSKRSEVLSVGGLVGFRVRFDGSGLDEAVEQIETSGAFGASNCGPRMDRQDDVCDVIAVTSGCRSNIANGIGVIGEPAFAEIEGFDRQIADLLS